MTSLRHRGGMKNLCYYGLKNLRRRGGMVDLDGQL
jgi:hypothetical protein